MNQVYNFQINIFLSLKISLVIANSADLDEMLQSAVFIEVVTALDRTHLLVPNIQRIKTFTVN